MEVQCPLRCRMGEGPLFTARWERTFQPHSASTDTTLAENGRCVLFVFCTWLPLTLPGVALLLPRGSEILDSPLGLLWYHLAGKGGIPLYLFWDGILSSSFSLLTWGTVLFVFFFLFFFFLGCMAGLGQLLLKSFCLISFLVPWMEKEIFPSEFCCCSVLLGFPFLAFPLPRYIKQTKKKKQGAYRLVDSWIPMSLDSLTF